MKTKSFLFFFAFSFLICFSSVAVADTPTNDGNTALAEKEIRAKIDVLTERITDLKKAKKHATTKVERQQIRHEIRDVKKEAKALKQQVSGGIYIGTGVLLVALLLILLL